MIFGTASPSSHKLASQVKETDTGAGVAYMADLRDVDYLVIVDEDVRRPDYIHPLRQERSC